MRVLFLSTGLATGGAEKQLVRLVGELVRHGVQASVIALRGGPVVEELQALRANVEIAGLSGVGDLPRALRTVHYATRAFGPDIVQGWMYHGNLAASFARRWAAPKAKLAWGVRQSLYDLAREKPGTRWVIRACAQCSRGAHAIVYNSHTARAQHEAFGFAPARAQVIDNGFDTERLRPDPAARSAVRAMLGLAESTPLIGLIARYHPMKGHEVFLQAATLLAQRRRDVHFLMAGRDVTPENPALRALFSAPVLEGRIRCLGERSDVPQLTAALDIASSSSWGEAFPNAVGEAMSCGVPVVATDVGDVRRIVDEAGIVVPVGDAEALAQAWDSLLADPERRKAMGEAGRQRVVEHYSVAAMAKRYIELYEELIRE